MGHLGQIVTLQKSQTEVEGGGAGLGFMGHLGQLSRELKSLDPLWRGNQRGGCGRGAAAKACKPIQYIFSCQSNINLMTI